MILMQNLFWSRLHTIASPTIKMKPDAKNQPWDLVNPSIFVLLPQGLTQTNPTGPAGMEYANVDAMDGKRPMILNAMPKTSIMVKLRRSSCL